MLAPPRSHPSLEQLAVTRGSSGPGGRKKNPVPGSAGGKKGDGGWGGAGSGGGDCAPPETLGGGRVRSARKESGAAGWASAEEDFAAFSEN